MNNHRRVQRWADRRGDFWGSARVFRLCLIALIAALSCVASRGSADSGTTPPPPVATEAPDAVSDAAPSAAVSAIGPEFLSGAQVAVVKIEGLIYDFVLESLERRVDRALDAGASVIVIELDTPGGVVTSALAISKYLKGLKVPTLAWVNNEAYSAGIMIASSCDAIVMAPSSATGDCAPIVPGQNLSPTERAKALSPILAEFRDSASANDYPYVLFHAMCVLGVKVYEVEHKVTGERKLVNAVDYRVMVEGVSMENAAKGASVLGFKVQPDEPGSPSLDVARTEDRGQWSLVQQVHDGQTLLTVTQDEAVELGLARAKDIRDLAALQNFLSAAVVQRVDQTWSEDLSGWLTSPAIRAILILALMLGAYVEFQSPGLGLPGAVAVIALVALIGAPFVVGLAEIWHVVLLLVGFLLLIVELTLIPGFGVFGVAGIVLMVMGLVLAVVPTGGDRWVPLPDPAVMGRLQQSALWTLLGLIVSIIGMFYLTRVLGRLPLFNRLILTSAEQATGTQATGLVAAEAAGHDRHEASLAVGDTGESLAPLHPAGPARFGERIVDVTTDGQWVEPHRPVRIIQMLGNQILVEPVEATGR